jgi:hypothetical protein
MDPLSRCNNGEFRFFLFDRRLAAATRRPKMRPAGRVCGWVHWTWTSFSVAKLKLDSLSESKHRGEALRGRVQATERQRRKTTREKRGLRPMAAKLEFFCCRCLFKYEGDQGQMSASYSVMRSALPRLVVLKFNLLFSQTKLNLLFSKLDITII